MRSIAPIGAIALLLLAGCGEERATRAETVDEPSSPVTAEAAESEAPEPDDAAGDPFSQEQVEAALLTVQDMPTGWSEDTSGDEEDSQDTTEPAECAQIFDAMLWEQQDPVAKADVDFTAGGFGPLLSQSIASFDDPTAEALAGITDALNQCPEFTSVDADGVRSDVTATALSFPNVGDSTVAVRLNFTAEDFDVVFDVIVVSIGNNSMTLVAGGLTPVDATDLEELARAGVSKIAAAANS